MPSPDEILNAKILVVDDCADNVDLMLEILREAGSANVTASATSSLQRSARTIIAATALLASGCSRAENAADAAASQDAASQVATSQDVAAGDVTPAAATAQAPAVPADSTTVTVYKSPTCGCCKEWEKHMRESGFTVVSHDVSDLNAVKHQHGVTQDIGSCHTATVGGYVLEGHVPAADVKRLLAERPAIAGLAVPGMPMGSPGMEGIYSDKFNVVAFDRTGGRSVFASY